MKSVHIIEAIADGIERKILGEWRHEGYIGASNSEQLIVTIDGQKYIISIAAQSEIDKILEPCSKAK